MGIRRISTYYPQKLRLRNPKQYLLYLLSKLEGMSPKKNCPNLKYCWIYGSHNKPHLSRIETTLKTQRLDPPIKGLFQPVYFSKRGIFFSVHKIRATQNLRFFFGVGLGTIHPFPQKSPPQPIPSVSWSTWRSSRDPPPMAPDQPPLQPGFQGGIISCWREEFSAFRGQTVEVVVVVAQIFGVWIFRFFSNENPVRFLSGICWKRCLE